MTDIRMDLVLDSVSMVFPATATTERIELFTAMSIVVETGQLVAIAGRSGSGKTTLLNIAAGLIRPTAGFVRWGPLKIEQVSEDERRTLRGRTIGLVFQGGGLISSLTAVENVAVPGISGHVTRNEGERALALLDRFELAGRARHFPFHLSGGEQQRVGIARALFRDPPILLVDEPTANLDRRTADSMIGILRELATKDKAILVASHDPGVLKVADTVVNLK